MAEKVVLFGPPASGKSTLTANVTSLYRDCDAFDFEPLWVPKWNDGKLDRDVDASTRLQTEVFQMLFAHAEVKRHLFVSPAYIHPDNFPPPWKMVWLIPIDKSVYVRGVRKREQERGMAELQLYEKYYDDSLNYFERHKSERMIRVDRFRNDGTARPTGEVWQEVWDRFGLSDQSFRASTRRVG